MSYPRILAEFVTFEVEGAVSVDVDPSTKTVTVSLDEISDLDAVKVTSVELNENSFFKAGEFPQVLDLTSPYQVTLSMYQDYDWTIKGVQHVDRYVRCANQVGSASFNAERCEASMCR